MGFLGMTHIEAKMMYWCIFPLLIAQVLGNEYVVVEQPVHHNYHSAGSGVHVSGHMGSVRIIPIAAGTYQHHTPYHHVAPAPVYHVEEPVHPVVPTPVYHVGEPVHPVVPAPIVPAPVYHVEEPVHHVAPVYHVQPPVAPVIVAPAYEQPPMVHPNDVTEHVEVENVDSGSDHHKREGFSSGFIPIVHSDDPDPSLMHAHTEYVEQVNDFSR